jgi:Flp pilus assembly pilin Flp
MSTNPSELERGRNWRQLLHRFHEDESGVAATEYIIVFALVALGATIALLATAVYVKGYRDFMLWWLAHPAV